MNNVGTKIPTKATRKDAVATFVCAIPEQLTATYSQAGMMAEAQALAATMLQHSPGFTLAVHEQVILYQDPAEVERYIAALRRAGLE